MIQLNQICKHYIDGSKVITALDNISITMTENEFIVITGVSGSGKSTLLNILSGTDYATAGEYIFNGVNADSFDIEDWNEFRCQNIGLVYQDFRLIEDYTAEENIELAVALFCSDSSRIKEYTQELMIQTGVSQFAKRQVRLLSGGQKQRVAIARALAKPSTVLLVDEPTANLDSENAAGIVDLLKSISNGRLVIVVTHNDELFKDVLTRRIVLSDGKIISDVSVDGKQIVSNTKINEKKDGSLLYGIFKHKKALIKVFLCILAVLICCLGIYSFCLNNISGYDEGLVNTEYFQNLSPERFVLTKKDNSKFVEQDYINIKSKYEVKNIITEDLALDVVGYIKNPYTHNSIEFYVQPLSNLYNELKVGRLPLADDEVVIFNEDGNPFYMMESDKDYFELNAGDYLSHDVKIVGWGEDLEHSRCSIYVSEELFLQLYMEAYYKYSTISLKSGSTVIDIEKIAFEERIPSGTVVFTDNKDYLNKNVELTLSNNQVTLKLPELIVESLDTYPELAENYKNVENCILINYEDYKKLLADNCYQISVFSEEYIESWDNYNVIYPYSVNISEMDTNDLVQRLFWFALCLIMSIAIILICYIFLRYIIKNEVIYVCVRKILGYSDKELFKFVLIRICMPIISSLFIISIVYGICCYCSDLYGYLKCFIIFANIPPVHFFTMSIMVCVLFAVLLINYVIKHSISLINLGGSSDD